MARSVGVRELKQNPSRYLRLVRDEREAFDITIRGEVVARLVPVDRRPDPTELAEYWQRHHQLAEELSRYCSEPFSAVEAIREQRRDL